MPSFWTFGLGREGMLFVPSLPHVIAACQATYRVSWSELAPFLSETGRAGLARLRGEEIGNVNLKQEPLT